MFHKKIIIFLILYTEQNPSEYNYKRALYSINLEYKEYFYWKDIILLTEKIWKNESEEVFKKALLHSFKTFDEVFKILCL